jgi:hypothetical protein
VWTIRGGTDKGSTLRNRPHRYPCPVLALLKQVGVLKSGWAGREYQTRYAAISLTRNKPSGSFWLTHAAGDEQRDDPLDMGKAKAVGLVVHDRAHDPTDPTEK